MTRFQQVKGNFQLLISLILFVIPRIVYGENASLVPLQETEFMPKQTGLLVTWVQPESQAREVGLRIGDILFSYRNTPITDISSLVEAVGASAAKSEESIKLQFARRDERLDVSVKPGKLGIQGTAVEKGKVLLLRPPPSGHSFDWSKLDHAPVDRWYKFMFGDEGQVGFDHVAFRKEGEIVHFTNSYGYDSKNYGRGYATIQIQFRVDKGLTILSFEGNNSYIQSHTKGQRDADKNEFVTVVTTEKGTNTTRVPILAGFLPGNLATHITGFVPQVEKLSIHYIHFDEFIGNYGNPAAFVTGEKAQLTVDGKSINVYRVDNFAIGERSPLGWVASDGTVYKEDFNGAYNVLSTKDEVLANMPASLRTFVH